ncbi:MAG: undecaprenyl-diphosphate phosphatase [bacterium]
MTLLQVLVLSILQGLTEFLPVSSSAHLVLVPALLGWPHAPVTLDVALHFGTLLALIVYFRKDIILLLKAFFFSLNRRHTFNEEEKTYVRLVWWIILGTIPVVVVALVFKKNIEAAFASAIPSAIFLLVTGTYMALADIFATPRKAIGQLNTGSALVIGISQAIALLPGISRSGTTLSTGMFFGLKREDAARFAFLLAIPALFGAFLLEIVTVPLGNLSIWLMLLGIAVSFGVGILCIHFFLRFLKKYRLLWFSAYCWAFGLFALIVLLWG